MKFQFLLPMLFMIGCSCSKQQHDKPFIPVSTNTVFSNEVLTSKGVEASLFKMDNELFYAYDPTMSGALDVARMDASGHITSGVNLMNNRRFSYLFYHNGAYYLLATINNSIYAWASSDLLQWTALNSGDPVLEAQPHSITAGLWNAGADIDPDGRWHLFVEASDSGNENAGLAYFTAIQDGNTLKFDSSRPTKFTVAKAGNPFVKYVTGRGLLVMYGSIATGYWDTRAMTLDEGAGSWRISRFEMGAPGIHVCDPTMEEANGNLYLAVSVDQREIHTMNMPGNFQTFYDILQ